MATHRVGTAEEVHNAGRIVIEVEGRSIGVFSLGVDIVALRNRCPHQGGPLCRGGIFPTVRATLDKRGYPVEHLHHDENVIACPWHGVEFDLRTGVCLADPTRRVRTYDTVIRDGEVFVVV